LVVKIPTTAGRVLACRRPKRPALPPIGRWLLVVVARSLEGVVSEGCSKFARMTRDDRLVVLELLASGVSAEEAGRAVGCTGRSVRRLVVALGGVRARRRPRSLLRLSLEEREEIRVGLRGGDSFARIARSIGRSASTVSREVSHNGGRQGCLECPRFFGHLSAGSVGAWPEDVQRVQSSGEAALSAGVQA
jgi:DNA-binding CsgD family transcriptional regulator